MKKSKFSERSIFLLLIQKFISFRITIHEYIDCSLENASAITSRLIISKPTVMYIHGFSENVEKKSVQTIVEGEYIKMTYNMYFKKDINYFYVSAYLKRNDHNIIAVDYSKFANDSYVTVARNAPHVANALTMILDKMTKVDFDTEKLHIIGHSMGSQISGYIGRKVNFKIPRITGENPEVQFLSADFYFDFNHII